MTNTQTNASKQPSHSAYHLREGNGKTFWTRIGAAWANKDGKGFHIQLDVMPLDGKIALRIDADKPDAE